MRAEALGELAHALDRLVAALADDVCRAELACKRRAGGMAAEDDDSFGAEASRGDDAAQADCSVSDHGNRLPRADLCRQGRVVACRHHVRKRQQRRHQLVVGADRQDDERSVCLRNADRFALSTVDAVEAVPASVQAGRVQPIAAEGARAVGPDEGRNDEVAGLQGADVGADGFDDADELVSHSPPGLVGRHLPVGPEVAAADRGAGDGDQGVGRLDEAGVRDGLDPNVAGAVHDSCAHRPGVESTACRPLSRRGRRSVHPRLNSPPSLMSVRARRKGPDRAVASLPGIIRSWDRNACRQGSCATTLRGGGHR